MNPEDDKIKKIYQDIVMSSFIQRGYYYDPIEPGEYIYGLYDSIGSHENAAIEIKNYFIPGMKLLDIGSGLGNIVRFAKEIGYDAYGVELRDTRKYNIDLNITYADFLSLKQSFISDFDVFYMYRTAYSPDDMNKFLSKLDKESKRGSIIIYSYSHIDDEQYLINNFNNFELLKNESCETGKVTILRVK